LAFLFVFKEGKDNKIIAIPTNYPIKKGRKIRPFFNECLFSDALQPLGLLRDLQQLLFSLLHYARYLHAIFVVALLE
jgi:hypothetical protein